MYIKGENALYKIESRLTQLINHAGWYSVKYQHGRQRVLKYCHKKMKFWTLITFPVFVTFKAQIFKGVNFSRKPMGVSALPSFKRLHCPQMLMLWEQRHFGFFNIRDLSHFNKKKRRKWLLQKNLISICIFIWYNMLQYEELSPSLNSKTALLQILETWMLVNLNLSW